MQTEKLQSRMKAALHKKLNFFLGLIENILNICVIEVTMKINIF